MWGKLSNVWLSAMNALSKMTLSAILASTDPGIGVSVLRPTLRVVSV